MNDSKSPKKPATTKPELKDYTLDVPMIDLGEVIKFITDIHEKALETATMAVVAEKLDYASASSTPFYRRVVAARLFELLTPQGAALTQRGLDYLKPDTGEAKNNALRDSILAIPVYEELVQLHQGKRLNEEIIRNGIQRKIAINQAGAAICAKCFVSSLKFADFLEADGSLKRFDIPRITEQETPLGKAIAAGKVPSEFSNQEENAFFLDKDRIKKVTLNCPLMLTKAEYDRIINWIKATWIIEDEKKGESS